jgi:hypothetical protein
MTMNSTTCVNDAPGRNESLRAWVDAPGLPLYVDQTYTLHFRFDHPGLGSTELGGPKLVLEWVATSEKVRLAPIDRDVWVSEGDLRVAPLWIARMTNPLSRGSESIHLALRVTPRVPGSPRITVTLVLRPCEPALGPGEVYHRVDVDLPSAVRGFRL